MPESLMTKSSIPKSMKGSMKYRFQSRTFLASAVILATTVYFAFAAGAAGKLKVSPSAAGNAAIQNPEGPDLEFITRLREEEFSHGQVMEIISDLTDKIGPR